jgi:hypothetical protein
VTSRAARAATLHRGLRRRERSSRPKIFPRSGAARDD